MRAHRGVLHPEQVGDLLLLPSVSVHEHDADALRLGQRFEQDDEARFDIRRLARRRRLGDDEPWAGSPQPGGGGRPDQARRSISALEARVQRAGGTPECEDASRPQPEAGAASAQAAGVSLSTMARRTSGRRV